MRADRWDEFTLPELRALHHALEYAGDTAFTLEAEEMLRQVKAALRRKSA